ncbi:MAG: CCA tRNA nucleotidyltransferase [Deltaproteobacteria bacterium]|nr:CCA tRNA nucleotidyltransferase [Deltaproteobacteria bacterium]
MQKHALSIVQRLRKHGHIAYFAGGCVRDMLMKRSPKDWDIATSAPPEIVLSLFKKTFEKGKAFGVISVLIQKKEYEVTTFRQEGKYSDGRHPDHVAWTNDRQDALRRDFTINGMFYDPIQKKFIDHVDGEKDLALKQIRAIGNPVHRFEEDKLRMIRAVRFATRFQFEIEPETKRAIHTLAPKIHEVSVERIRDELIKILTEGPAHQGLKLLSEVGLLKEILPEAEAMKGVAQPPEFHPEGDVWIHTLLALSHLNHPNPELAMGTLLHDIGKPPTFSIQERIRFDGHVDVGAQMAKNICRRLRFSNDQIEHIASLVRQHLQFINVRKMRKSTLKRFLMQERFDDHLELHRVDCLACHQMMEQYEFCKEKLEALRQEPPLKKPLVSGKDLIRLGFKPGILFKEILHDVETAYLEGAIQNKREGLKWVQHKFSSAMAEHSKPQHHKKKRPTQRH